MVWSEEHDVYRVTERRGGAVYRTVKLGQVWIPVGTNEEQESEIARQHGGDIVAPTGKYDSR